MLAMYRRRDDQRESLDWQSRGQAFGARALNPIECGPLPANVSFLSVLDDKTSQMLFVLWRQVALVKGTRNQARDQTRVSREPAGLDFEPAGLNFEPAGLEFGPKLA